MRLPEPGEMSHGKEHKMERDWTKHLKEGAQHLEHHHKEERREVMHDHKERGSHMRGK